MAIQNRRGAYVDLNPAKAVPGELLVVQSGDPNTTDGKAVYMTFASGDIKLLAMKSDVETAVADVAEDLLTELDNTISTFTETTAPGAVADVADEGAAQITAIGNKGDEVLDSIPQDYTELSDDVSDLKSAINGKYAETELYDVSTNTTGGCLRADGTKRSTAAYVITDYMPVDASKCRYEYTGLIIGHNYAYTCFYDSGKVLMPSDSITLYDIATDGAETYTLSVPDDAAYVRFSIYIRPASDYGPSTFSFKQIDEVIGTNKKITELQESNHLFRKTVLFFGDSICAGTTDTDGGWAGRIGMANAMIYHNYGYNGATVTAITGHHCIAADVVSAVSTYPTPDFVILEGGTNDADNLDEAGIGTFTENDYSGSYDTTTFSGAFETMLYNAVQQWPHAQIGYISAHKMGNGNNRAIRRTYFLRAQELCKKWGVPFIDLWIESKLNRDLSAQYDSSMTGEENIAAHKSYTDGQHLTPDGYALITPQIEWWMRGI